MCVNHELSHTCTSYMFGGGPEWLMMVLAVCVAAGSMSVFE